MTAANTSNQRIFAFASGKGGVGKTSLCLNTAYQLAQRKQKVLVLDADLGLANVDVQLGVTPKHDLGHILSGQMALEQAITKTERGFDIIAGRSGGDVPVLFDALQRRQLLDRLRDLAGSYDQVLIDIAAGVDGDVLQFANFADQTILVLTPDPSSLTDAYAVVKLLLQRYNEHNCQAVINQASTAEAEMTFKKLSTAVEKFLENKIELLTNIPYDRQYATAIKLQQLASVAYADCDAVKAVGQLADNLMR